MNKKDVSYLIGLGKKKDVKFKNIEDIDKTIEEYINKKFLRYGWNKRIRKIAKKEKLDDEFLNLDIDLINE